MRRPAALPFLAGLGLFWTAAARAQTPVPIAEAKGQPLGTVVTVAGRVTVAGEFGGPTYFQDETGGMPVFFAALTAAVVEGDSVVVTGPLSEFGATTGQPGTGLGQISCPAGNTACMTFTVVPGPRRVLAPRVVRLADFDEALEGQLVTVDGVRFATAGSFQANTSYNLTDGTTTAQVYVDNTTNLVNAAIPTGTFRIVGVIGQNRGTRQLQPRRAADVGAAPFVYPGEGVPKDATFEVATWNIAFFGSAPFGTVPDTARIRLQIANAARVLRAIDADLYGLQEIVSTRAFQTLIDSLNAGRPGAYRGLIAPIRQVQAGEDPAEAGQKTAFIYRAATVDPVRSGFLTTAGNWAFCCGAGGGGRYPFAFTFNARNASERITAVVIHAKAGSSIADYNERTSDVAQLKAALDARPNEAFILLGDYNDDVDVSTVGARRSPYADFVEQTAAYRVVSKTLSDGRFQTTSGGQVIDHIAISNELFDDYFEGTVRVENPNYIPSYAATTSDHFPVWARFNLSRAVAAEPGGGAGDGFGPVFPNPATGSFRVRREAGGDATMEVYDALGRRVLARTVPAGTAEAAVETGGWAPGAYVVRLSAGGRVSTRTVVVTR